MLANPLNFVIPLSYRRSTHADPSQPKLWELVATRIMSLTEETSETRLGDEFSLFDDGNQKVTTLELLTSKVLDTGETVRVENGLLEYTSNYFRTIFRASNIWPE